MHRASPRCCQTPALPLQDALLRGDTAADVGRAIILPSTFVGGPIYMHQAYQDVMRIVAKLGKPDLFITFTCNPQWPEIRDELLQGQRPLTVPISAPGCSK
jgi:hypothetical protein